MTLPSKSIGAYVPWEAEAWPIIEHEPERIPVIPPDLLSTGVQRSRGVDCRAQIAPALRQQPGARPSEGAR